MLSSLVMDITNPLDSGTSFTAALEGSPQASLFDGPLLAGVWNNSFYARLLLKDNYQKE